MTIKKRIVERYLEGFRAGDHEMILDCLTDDVEREMPPHFELKGRAAFDDAIENDASRDDKICRLVIRSIGTHASTHVGRSTRDRLARPSRERLPP